MTMGSYIKERRLALSMTQADLGGTVDVDLNLIGQILIAATGAGIAALISLVGNYLNAPKTS